MLITGCSSDSPQAMFEDYIYRLSNVTDVDAPKGIDGLSLMPYPGARDLVIESEDLRIGFVDYFHIAECDLMELVSERNSSLGRFRRSSGALLYEMEFYEKISRCDEALGTIAQSDDASRAEFMALVGSIRESKSEVLPVAYWNATFASPEIRVQLSTTAKPFGWMEAVDVSAVDTALSYLVWVGEHLYEGRPSISTAEFETHYYHLQAQKTVGRLIRSLQVSHRNLLIATEMLATAAKRNKICPMGKKTRKGEFVHNVFVKFYAGGVQPYLSRIYRPSDQLFRALHRLFDAQAVKVPRVFLDYFQAVLDQTRPDGLWQRFDAQLKAHTRAWQTVLRQCDLMPKGPIVTH